MSEQPVTPPHEAASQGRRLGIWRPSSSGPNAVQSGAGVVLNRSRDLVRNNPWAHAAIERSVSNGVGVGIQCKSLWGSKDWRKADSKLWKRFSKHCDADGAVWFEGLQAIAWREWREAGEVFVRLRSRRQSDGLPVPLQIQLIESEQCPRDYYATAANGNPIRAGIEFDFIGRRAAYWMYPAHPGEYQTGVVDGGSLRRIPADQIRHIFKPERAGQHRGMPGMASAMVELWNMAKMRDAVLERHKLGNLFAMFYTREAEASTESIGLDMQTGTDVDDTPIAGLEPGTAQELPPGVKPIFSDPPDAGSNYWEFIRGHLLAYAAACGVPYEILTGDLNGVSDRALKLILNEFRRLIEMDQWVYFIPQFCQAIREAYMDAAVLVGALVVAGYAEIRDEVCESQWVPQGWPYSHPVQDVTADLKAIRGGLQSRSATILANGDDPEQVDAEIRADQDRADALELKFDTDARTPAPVEPAPQKGNSDDELQ